MKGFKGTTTITISFLFITLLVSNQVADSRSILVSSNTRNDWNILSLHAADAIADDFGSNESNLQSTCTCQETYGFLPCSSSVGGLLVLIVVYEILLTYAGTYVASGSDLFFGLIGSGKFGTGLFQFLGIIPQIVLVLASSLSGSDESARQRAKLGVGLIAGTATMLLTLIWGASVVFGSIDLSASGETTVPDPDSDHQSENPKTTTKGKYGVATDVETSYTPCIILITLVPFLVLLLAKLCTTSEGKRVIILIALVITAALLFVYVLYQVFRPQVKNRVFEYLLFRHAKDKLLRQLIVNGKADPTLISTLFKQINTKGMYISPSELRIFVLGVMSGEDGDSKSNTDKDVESIVNYFDENRNHLISEDEFIKGMTKLVSELSDMTPDTSEGSGPLKQWLEATGKNLRARRSRRPENSWQNWTVAFAFVTAGVAMLCVLSEPLINSVVAFSQVANFSSFSIAYLVIPFAMNYRIAEQAIRSVRNKDQKSISLTLSSLYSGVYMNNAIGLIVFLAPVYALNLPMDVFAEIIIVVIICGATAVVASFRTTFPRWMGYLMIVLYPVSLALIYVVTNVLGWS